MRVSRFTQFVCSTLIASILLAAIPAGFALAAGDCDDGTAGPDVIVCIADPVFPDYPDDDVGLDFGDDQFTLEELVFAGTVSGDGLDTGAENTGNGDDDELNIEGTVFLVIGDNTDGNGGNDVISIGLNGGAIGVFGDRVTGNGGNDVITVDGVVDIVFGDFATGNGGADTIIINGDVLVQVSGDLSDGDGGNDTIIVNGFVDSVVGDDVNGNGGDDLIVINGEVLNSVTGDCAAGDGGDDHIIVNGEVGGNIFGDCAGGAGGDDTVTIGAGAIVGGLIDGNDGFDILNFEGATQSQLDGLDPAGGSITIGGITFTWANFESLIGLLAEIAERLGLRILYRADNLLATADGEGISVYAEHGRIAFVSFATAAELELGESQIFQTGNAAGWYVSVSNVGAGPNGNTEFQVSIFNPSGTMVGQFSFFN